MSSFVIAGLAGLYATFCFITEIASIVAWAQLRSYVRRGCHNLPLLYRSYGPTPYHGVVFDRPCGLVRWLPYTFIAGAAFIGLLISAAFLVSLIVSRDKFKSGRPSAALILNLLLFLGIFTLGWGIPELFTHGHRNVPVLPRNYLGYSDVIRLPPHDQDPVRLLNSTPTALDTSAYSNLPKLKADASGVADEDRKDDYGGLQAFGREHSPTTQEDDDEVESRNSDSPQATLEPRQEKDMKPVDESVAGFGKVKAMLDSESEARGKCEGCGRHDDDNLPKPGVKDSKDSNFCMKEAELTHIAKVAGHFLTSLFPKPPPNRLHQRDEDSEVIRENHQLPDAPEEGREPSVARDAQVCITKSRVSQIARLAGHVLESISQRTQTKELGRRDHDGEGEDESKKKYEDVESLENDKQTSKGVARMRQDGYGIVGYHEDELDDREGTPLSPSSIKGPISPRRRHSWNRDRVWGLTGAFLYDERRGANDAARATIILAHITFFFGVLLAVGALTLPSSDHKKRGRGLDKDTASDV